ncbi:MAG: chromosomal replication initiator protein DnaA [Pseudomonadota bacterium]
MSSLAAAQVHENVSPEGSSEGDWIHIQQELKLKLGEATFKSWVRSLEWHEFSAGTLILSAPTRFIRDWVRTNFLEAILAVSSEQNTQILAVDIIVTPKAAPQNTKLGELSSAKEQAETSESLGATDTSRQGLEKVGTVFDSRFTFDNFVVGKSNELAYAAALRVAESEKASYNPLFLYGGVGLGKTHLMHAIGWHIKKIHPKRKVIYVSAEKFMYQFIRALRYRDTMAFKEQFRSVDVLMIDDVQFIGGKESTQEEFFHTFNALVDQNHQVIVSADKSPSEMEGMEERLKSRLGWGLVADIHPTTYELRLGILQAKVDQFGLGCDKSVLEFLAHKICSNVRELEGALNRIVAHSTLVGREVSLEMTQEVLHDILRASDRRVTIEEIQKKVAQHYNIRITDMHSAKRLRSVVRPRQVAMYLAKRLTAHSLPEIGRKFGGRDHTTVLHAVKKVEELKKADFTLSEDIELLVRTLRMP